MFYDSEEILIAEQEFASYVIAAPDQVKSVIYPLVSEEPGLIRAGEKTIDILNSADELDQITQRGADLKYSTVGEERRYLPITGYEKAVLVSDMDELRRKYSLKAPNMMQLQAALQRQIDSTIITAARADVAYKTDTGSVATSSLPTAQVISAGGTGLTEDKIKEAAYLLDKEKIPAQERVFIVAAKQKQELLAIDHYISNRYGPGNKLPSWELGNFDGFDFHMTQLLELSGTTRYCLAFHRSAIRFGWSLRPTANITIADGKSDQPFQIYIKTYFGAVRAVDKALVVIECDES